MRDEVVFRLSRPYSVSINFTFKRMGSFSDWCLQVPIVPRLSFRPTRSWLNGSQFVNIDISARSDYLGVEQSVYCMLIT